MIFIYAKLGEYTFKQGANMKIIFFAIVWGLFSNLALACENFSGKFVNDDDYEKYFEIVIVQYDCDSITITNNNYQVKYNEEALFQTILDTPLLKIRRQFRFENKTLVVIEETTKDGSRTAEQSTFTRVSGGLNRHVLLLSERLSKLGEYNRFHKEQ